MNHPVSLSTLAYVANNVANFVGNNSQLAQIRMARALGYLNSFRMALPVAFPATPCLPIYAEWHSRDIGPAFLLHL